MLLAGSYVWSRSIGLVSLVEQLSGRLEVLRGKMFNLHFAWCVVAWCQTSGGSESV